MVVGVCRIVLGMAGVTSLKEKRAIVRRLVDRIRHRFDVAIAEVADMDSHRRAVLGLAVVSNDGRHARSMIDRIVAYASGASEAMLVDRATEILHLDDHFGIGEAGLQAAIDRAYGDDDGE